MVLNYKWRHLLCCCFTAVRHFSGHFGRGPSTYPHCSWASLLGSKCTFFSPVTENCPSWISGRVRMDVEIISWPIYTIEMLPAVRIESETVRIPGGRASDRATALGNCRHVNDMWTSINYLHCEAISSIKKHEYDFITRVTIAFDDYFQSWLSSSELLMLNILGRVKQIWYLSPMRAAKVQASLRIRAVSPEPPLLAQTSSESRGTFRQKARSLAPLNGWTCAVKICHDGMLEDTNSLDAAHTIIGHLFSCLRQTQHLRVETGGPYWLGGNSAWLWSPVLGKSQFEWTVWDFLPPWTTLSNCLSSNDLSKPFRKCRKIWTYRSPSSEIRTQMGKCLRIMRSQVCTTAEGITHR